MSLFRFALYFLPENLRPPPNWRVCAHDAHSNLVFLHFPRLSDLSLFLLRQVSMRTVTMLRGDCLNLM